MPTPSHMQRFLEVHPNIYDVWYRKRDTGGRKQHLYQTRRAHKGEEVLGSAESKRKHNTIAGLHKCAAELEKAWGILYLWVNVKSLHRRSSNYYIFLRIINEPYSDRVRVG